MKTPTTPVRMDTPHGPLYIAVTAAKRYSYHDSERGNVTELRPYLRIASDAAFEADPNAADHWTIRRRSYGVHWVMFFEDRTHIEYASGLKGERWHQNDHTPDQGGFRNDKRHPVGFDTATYDLMWDAVTAALDAFASAHPAWADLSRYLLHVADMDGAHIVADTAQREYERAVDEARMHENLANDVFASLPGSLAEMVVTDQKD